MKLRMYMDFWPTSPQEGKIHTATTAPSMKMLGTVRVAFDVHIPDDILHKPDSDDPRMGVWWCINCEEGKP